MDQSVEVALKKSGVQFHPEDGTSTSLRNVCTYLPIYTALHPRIRISLNEWSIVSLTLPRIKALDACAVYTRF
jgi:hypothetical protein